MVASTGWQGINFHSPFAQLALLLNLGWLQQLLLVDAVISPSGALFLGVGISGRNTFGMGQNKTFPKWLARVDVASGVPRNALLVNFVVSVVFLFVFQSWQNLVSALGMFFAVAYAVIAIAAGANRFEPRLRVTSWAKGMHIIAPASFVFSALIMYWAGWPEVRMALLLTLIALPWFAYRMRQDSRMIPASSFRNGIWFVVFLLVIGLLSALGSFKGSGAIPAPVDSLVVGVAALAMYFWAIRSSRRWLTSREAELAGGDY